MTPWQVRHLLFRERDKDGKLMIGLGDESDLPPQDPRYYFFEHWRRIGLREDLIEKLWREQQDGRGGD